MPIRNRWLAGFIVLLGIWAALFLASIDIEHGPNGRALGADFAMFWTASHVLQQGQNPYDHRLLFRRERALLTAEHLPAPPVKLGRSIVRVGNPPFFLAALQPLNRLGFQQAAALWMGLMYLLTLLGGFVLLRFLGWTATAVPLILLSAMPQVAIGEFYGNVNGLIFAALSVSLALYIRYPAVAGALATLAWIKPQIGLPFAALIALTHFRSMRPFAAAFGVVSVALVIASALTSRPRALSWWIGGLLHYQGDIDSQPNLSSLTGLYARILPAVPRSAVGAGTIVAALVITGIVVWHHRHGTGVRLSVIACLWLVWFLATPYAHLQDEIILAFPILLLIGPNAHRFSRTPVVLAVYALLLSVLLFSWTPDGIQFPCLPVLFLLGVSLVREQRSQCTENGLRSSQGSHTPYPG